MVAFGSVYLAYLGWQIMAGSYACNSRHILDMSGLEVLINGICFILGNFIVGSLLVLIGVLTLSGMVMGRFDND